MVILKTFLFYFFGSFLLTLIHAVLCMNVLGEVIRQSHYLSEFVVEIHQQMNRFICDLQLNLYKEESLGGLG